MVLQTCALHSVPNFPQFWQLSHDQFLVFHPLRAVLTVTCEDKQRDSDYFSGLKGVRVPKGCSASNTHFLLRSSDVVASDHYLLETPPLELNSSLLGGHPDRNISAVQIILGEAPRQLYHEPDNLVLERPSATSGPAVWSSLAFGVGAFLAVLVLSFVLFLRYRRLSAQMNSPTLSPKCTEDEETTPV